MPEETVTLKDVYTQVTALVGHMEAVTERNRHADQVHQDHETRLRLLEAMNERIRRGDQVDADHETRLRLLERWRYSLPASLILAAGSAGVAIVSLLTQ